MLCCVNHTNEVVFDNYDYLQEKDVKEINISSSATQCTDNAIDKIMEYYKKELLKEEVMELSLEEMN